jgi:hypothetical protein
VSLHTTGAAYNILTIPSSNALQGQSSPPDGRQRARSVESNGGGGDSKDGGGDEEDVVEEGNVIDVEDVVDRRQRNNQRTESVEVEDESEDEGDYLALIRISTPPFKKVDVGVPHKNDDHSTTIDEETHKRKIDGV